MNCTNYNLSLLHLNIRSLDKHSNELTALIISIDKTIDIIALTEKGRKNIENRAALFSDAYNMTYELPDSNFREAAFMINKEIDYTVRTNLEIRNPNYENI